MTATGRICSRFPQVSALCCEHRQRNRDSPLKISLIKSPTSLVPYLASPLTLAEYIAYIIILEKSVFPWLTLGCPDYPKRVPVRKEKVFFPVFSCHHSLSVSVSVPVSFICLSSALLQIFYAWINSKPCRIYHTLAPIFSLGHRKEEKKISTYMHPLRRDTVISHSFRVGTEEDRRRFIDSDKAVSIRAPSPDSDRWFGVFFYGEQTWFTIRRLLRMCHIVTVCTTF